MSQQPSTLLAHSGQPLALHLVEEISHRVVNEYTEAIAILALAASRGHAPADLALARAANRLRAHADSHRAFFRADGQLSYRSWRPYREGMFESLACIARGEGYPFEFIG
jgi:two-component sensor histidine kinase